MLENFKNNQAVQKLFKTFDYEITDVYRAGIKISEPVRERLESEFLESFKTNKPDLSKIPELSYFKRPVTNVQPYAKVTLPKVFQVVTGDYYKKQTEKLHSTSKRNS